MHAAANAARTARRHAAGHGARRARRSLATARAAAPAAAASPTTTYSENEFPDRQEPPVITRTHAADVALPVRNVVPATARSAIAATRGIGPRRPAHVPPNVPPASLPVPATRTTTLPNGVRVGSMDTCSQVSSVGVLADFGSRHEAEGTDATVATAGANHLMELLAFQSTTRRSGADVRHAMEELGGASFATASREQMLYGVDVLRPNVGAGFGLLADTVLRPAIDDGEVEEMKQVIEFQSTDVLPQILMGEGLQTAAYGPRDGALQQLGRPHFCAAEALPHLSAHSVHAFREKCLLRRPGALVVAGSGIAHDVLVGLAEEHFGHLEGPATPGADDAAGDGGLTVPSAYTGGEYRRQCPPDPNPAKEEFTHVAIAFEVGGWHSHDLVPTCVLQTLLGGGSSFSAGGPGKGMYSRLYREVLNAYRWAESAEAFSSFHAESGLWGISGSCPPARGRALTRALVNHFLKLAHEPVTDEELSRARNMLKCNVLTQLESRLVLFEDIGRQILTYGTREDAATMCAKIDAVTQEDIRAVVRKALTKPPTVSTVGIDIEHVPVVGEVEQWLAQGPPKNGWF